MADKPEDPYYTRKQIPDELIKDVFPTGLSKEEEIDKRAAKLKGLKKFWPTDDPYYHRKQVPDDLVKDIPIPGLTPEEAHEVRERKLSRDGADLRNFSSTKDPYYLRKQVPTALVKEVGKLDADPTELYEAREHKLAQYQLTADPFDQITGRRSSVIAPDASVLGPGRRRSSAVAPDHVHNAQTATAGHKGANGGEFAPIISRPEPVMEESSTPFNPVVYPKVTHAPQ